MASSDNIVKDNSGSTFLLLVLLHKHTPCVGCYPKDKELGASKRPETNMNVPPLFCSVVNKATDCLTYQLIRASACSTQRHTPTLALMADMRQTSAIDRSTCRPFMTRAAKSIRKRKMPFGVPSYSISSHCRATCRPENFPSGLRCSLRIQEPKIRSLALNVMRLTSTVAVCLSTKAAS